VELESTTRWRWGERRRGLAAVLGALAALSLWLIAAHAARADHPGVGRVTGPAAQSPQPPEPPVRPTPRAQCGPGSRPETGIQGRVTPEDHESGRAARGFTCNTQLVGSYQRPNPQGTVGGFKVERYVDSSGRECAYYDTTLMYPTNALDQEGGVNVLDMSNPSQPVLTDRLLTPAMQTPHESLVLSRERGILAAVAGNLTTQVGIIDVYDVSQDCRHPVLKSSTPMGVLGHESGLAPDGRTFYSASPAGETIVAVDISNPSLPVPLWFGRYDSHGLSISNDGNRAYVAGIDSGQIILDTSQVQARVTNPTVREISRIQWGTMSIPQNAIPITIDGHPYTVEIDEFGGQEKVGAGRIIDIADEQNPRVISNLRLEVHQPENFPAQENDNGARNPTQGYAGHYCNVPRRDDPGIVACSFILSGLRVFDIRDPHDPREIAYFNAPVTPRIVPPAGVIPSPSNWAMASPAFAPERSEIWYSDGLAGFFAVRLTNQVAPFGPRARSCLPRRARIGRRGIAGIRLWQRRRRLLRMRVKPLRRTRRSFRYCVRGSRARVSAVFRHDGRVELITTTARGHRTGRIRPGASRRAVRRAYPRRRAVGRGLVRAGRRSPHVIGFRRGRVRFVAVANRILRGSPRKLRRHLRIAGL
jgi:hypothetical protein